MSRSTRGRQAARGVRLNWLAAGLALTAGVASAQSVPVIPPSADPGVIQERSREMERRLREEGERRPDGEPAVDQDAIKRAPARPAPGGSRFLLKHIDFTQSELLSEQALRELAAGLEGREVTLADVQALVDRINEIYRQRGVPTAQAILPAQEVADGVLNIKLVEGRVGRITVSGNASTDEIFLTDRIGQKPGDLADVSALEESMLRFNRSQDVQMRAELKPGAKFAETDVALTLTEPPRHELRIFSDTSGSQATGVYRLGVFYQNRSLFGRRDSLGFTVVGAEGHLGGSASYSVPIWTKGTRLTVSWFNDQTRIVNGPFSRLHISGESTAWTALLRHPLLMGRQYQLDVLAGAKTRTTDSWIESRRFQSTDIVDGSLGIDGQWWEADRIWSGSLTYSHGSAKAISDVVSTKFDIWRGSLRRVQDFSDGWSVHANTAFQYTTDDNLTSSEQFLIGGDGSVRGYQTGLFSGDKGITASLELHHPLPQLPLAGLCTSGFAFVDYGATKPFRPVGSTRGTDTLAGYGWGLNVGFKDNLSARITLGLPIRDREQDPRGYYINVQLVAQVF